MKHINDMIDETHDPVLRSWVRSANGHADFPIQNLPFGIFRPSGGAPRGGIAIGDSILDLDSVYKSGLLTGESQAACAACLGGTLNTFLDLGSQARRVLRRDVSRLLSEGAQPSEDLLHRASDCTMQMPVHVGDYTDFYAGIHHARSVGKLFRPDNSLLPNYKWVPIGYHGRASSIRVSGHNVRRPNGQSKSPDQMEPSFGPSKRLDYELELGLWIGPGNELGEPIPISDAAESIAGFCLLNDWSARDFQVWEYQPLGPFLAKNFHTTVSAWIVTPEALAPFRAAQPSRPESDPRPLPYLFDRADQEHGAFDLNLEVFLSTASMRSQGLAPLSVSSGNAIHLYWTPAQLIAHQTSNGCNLNAGDLIGTGTISSPSPSGHGSILEITEGGLKQIELPSGETRTFLEDGDEVSLRARAVRPGFVSIGFGECKATVLPASRERFPTRRPNEENP